MEAMQQEFVAGRFVTDWGTYTYLFRDGDGGGAFVRIEGRGAPLDGDLALFGLYSLDQLLSDVWMATRFLRRRGWSGGVVPHEAFHGASRAAMHLSQAQHGVANARKDRAHPEYHRNWLAGAANCRALFVRALSDIPRKGV